MKPKKLRDRCLHRGMLGRENHVPIVAAPHRMIRRDADDRQMIDFPELLLVMDAGAGHAGHFVKEPEETLVGDARHRAVLLRNRDMLLCFDCFVKTGFELVARKYPARLRIEQQDLPFGYDVVFIHLQRFMRPERETDVPHHVRVLLREKIRIAEIALGFRDARFCQPHALVLDRIIVITKKTHEGIRDLVAARLHLPRARDNKRHRRHIEKHRIRLINDDVIELPHVAFLRVL